VNEEGLGLRINKKRKKLWQVNRGRDTNLNLANEKDIVGLLRYEMRCVLNDASCLRLLRVLPIGQKHQR